VAEGTSSENHDRGLSWTRSRDRVLLLTALALALALGVTVGLRSGPVAGAFCACLFLTVVLSAADPRFGLLAVLSVAPFDGLLREQLSCAYLWYPDALHVMDPIAAALLLGWFARWALGRVEVKWRWYDWLAAAFLAVSMIAALRGFLAGHERALAASRFIPAMAVYLPAREVLADPAGRRKFLRWLVWYGILYSIGVLVLAFALRDTYGRGHDVLLPRICRCSVPCCGASSATGGRGSAWGQGGSAFFSWASAACTSLMPLPTG